MQSSRFTRSRIGTRDLLRELTSVQRDGSGATSPVLTSPSARLPTSRNTLPTGDMEALKLTGREKQIYVEAERAIAGTGLPMHSVAHDFARAFDILGGAHIVEAARYYKKHVDVDLPQITVSRSSREISRGERG